MTKAVYSYSMGDMILGYIDEPTIALYRLDIGKYYNTFSKKSSGYNINPVIMKNVDMFELFILAFEYVLNGFTEFDNMAEIDITKWNQQDLTFNISEYAGVNIDPEIIHIPSEMIEYIITMISSNIDTSVMTHNAYMIPGYDFTSEDVRVTIKKKKRIEV